MDLSSFQAKACLTIYHMCTTKRTDQAVDCPDDWNPHVGMSLEAEGEDGGADEEHRHDANYL